MSRQQRLIHELGMGELPHNMVAEIALKLDYDDIMSLCTVYPRLCRDDNFWRNKFISDYTDHYTNYGDQIMTYGNNWRERYNRFRPSTTGSFKFPDGSGKQIKIYGRRDKDGNLVIPGSAIYKKLKQLGYRNVIVIHAGRQIPDDDSGNYNDLAKICCVHVIYRPTVYFRTIERLQEKIRNRELTLQVLREEYGADAGLMVADIEREIGTLTTDIEKLTRIIEIERDLLMPNLSARDRNALFEEMGGLRHSLTHKESRKAVDLSEQEEPVEESTKQRPVEEPVVQPVEQPEEPEDYRYQVYNERNRQIQEETNADKRNFLLMDLGAMTINYYFGYEVPPQYGNLMTLWRESEGEEKAMYLIEIGLIAHEDWLDEQEM